MENLRYMLSHYNPTDPLYLGCRFKPFSTQGYMSGGSGYILSRTAAARFVKDAIPNKTLCLDEDTINEDIEISKCLVNVGVKILDSRDPSGKGRFFPMDPEFHLTAKRDDSFWYWKYIYYDVEEVCVLTRVFIVLI